MLKTVLFVPADTSERNAKFNSMFMNSLKKFHPELEVRLIGNTTGDPDFWYRAKPIIASELFKEGYEMVIGADNDQIITGSLDDILNDTDDYDVGVVLNDQTYPMQVWDITHPKLYNNGLVVMKSQAFVEHWKRLCFTSHFKNYQYREQDLLNLLASDYFNYKVKLLDHPGKFYGEAAKPYWAQSTLDNGNIMIDKAQLCVIHFGGGNTPDKGNYRIRFPEDVVKRIEELIA